MTERIKVLGAIDYVAAEGESFDKLALDAYDDEKLASVIAEANPGLASVLLFEGGEQVKIPILSEDEMPDTLPPWRR